MISEIILLVAIAILVYAIYRLAIAIYADTKHDFGMIYHCRMYRFPELDALMESVRNGEFTSDYYKARYQLRPTISVMGYFPTIDDPVMEYVHRILSNYMTGMTLKQRANFILAFVQQNTRYVSDSKATGRSDDWKFPITTLVDGYGDCEDMSFLLANLLWNDGQYVIVAWVTRHMTVGVNVPGWGYNRFEKDYLQAEATSISPIGYYFKHYDEVYGTSKIYIPGQEFTKYITKEAKQ